MKINKLIPLSLLPVSIASCYCFTSCNSNNGKTSVLVTGVTLDKTTLNINLKDASPIKLIATVLPTDATDKSVAWKSDNTSVATVDENGNVTAKAAGNANITVTTKDGNKIATCRVIVTKESTTINFANCTWDELNSYCLKLENSEITTEQFCASFTKDGTTPIASMSDFIGLLKTITINEKEYKIRVIGTQHDTIAENGNDNSKKAAFTFEMVSLLSDSSGNKLTTHWDSSVNYNYLNSVLRANLNGSGTGTKSFDKPVLSILSSDLQNVTKTVKKSVATTTDYEITTYEDKLFPLTYTEMALSGSEYAKAEGTPYTYWTNHNTDVARIKSDISAIPGVPYGYWLRSPWTNSNLAAWYVNETGAIDYKGVSSETTYGVSFAFCI